METIRDKSEFNSASQFVIDIEKLFLDSTRFYIIGDYRTSFNILCGLVNALSAEMKEELDEFLRLKKEINDLFVAHNRVMSKRGVTPVELIDKLDEFSIKLHRLWKDSGLQNKAIKDKRFAATDG